MASADQKQRYVNAYDKNTGGTGEVQRQTNLNMGQSQVGANDALTEYQNNLRAATDPNAAAANRSGFNDSINQTRNMISGIAANPGYTPAEQQQMKLATTNPIAGAYGAARGEMANHVAQTGNEAGFGATLSKLKQAQATDTSTGLAGLSQKEGDARRADTQSATQMSMAIPGMYSQQQQNETQNLNAFQFPVTSQFQNYATNLQGQLSALGIDSSNMAQLNQQAMQPGFWEKLALAGVGASSGAMTKLA